MSTQLAYSLGDPLPSGCTPYMYVEPTTGVSKWYTTCERPSTSSSIETQQPNTVQSQQVQVVTPTIATQTAPPVTYYTNQETISLLTILPLYLILISCAAFSLLLLYLISRYLLLKKELRKPHTILSIKPTNNTTESPLATEQLFTHLHAVIAQKTLGERMLHEKTFFSMEIVATKKEGIRYLIRTSEENVSIVKKLLFSYLPGVSVEKIPDYFSKEIVESAKKDKAIGLLSFRFTNHFSIPVEEHAALSQHDPIAYLTGNMTKLRADEVMSFQLILSPIDSASNRVKNNEVVTILNKLWKGEDISATLFNNKLIAFLYLPIRLIGDICYWSIWIITEFVSHCFFVFDTQNSNGDIDKLTNTIKQQEKKKFIPTPTQQSLFTQVQTKLEQPLFETTMRLLVIGNTGEETTARIRGFTATFATFANVYQQIVPKYHPLTFLIPKFVKEFFLNVSFFFLTNRLLSFTQDLIFSTTELASLYHFPYTKTSKTEDLITVKAKELPAPLSLKQTYDNLDSIFAQNTFGGESTMIGLTKEERQRHVYMLGATGTGKSTLMLSMIEGDMQRGKGICVIDPHGELAEKVLASVPPKRKDDVIYFNPDDLDYPVSLNLLELTPGLAKSDSLREKEFIAESVVSLFRKVFTKSSADHAHRIEYILRNTIHTAFTLPNPTLFTLFDLLEDPAFRKKAVTQLTDERLKKFWMHEFDKAGSWQQVKMVAPITAKIGRFLFSPVAKSILENPQSTINIDQAMNEGKILICNLAKGKLGEDTSEILGILLLNKIELATLKRARVKKSERRDFYLYVDEFQNFATPSFVNMLSEARKYHLSVTIAEQTTSQIADKNLVDIIFANVCSVICFRTANNTDEERILPIFSPFVQQHEIINLPSYHFYMKIASLTPQEAFSGETIQDTEDYDDAYVNELIDLSRKKYTASTAPPPQETKVRKKIKRKQVEEQTKKPTHKRTRTKLHIKENDDNDVPGGI